MQLSKNIICGVVALLAMGALAIDANGEIVHVAKKGETIYGIANMYHISPDAILNANPQARTGIKKGMSIVIPDGKGKPAAEKSKPAATASERQTPVTARKAQSADPSAAPSAASMPASAASAAAPGTSARQHTASLTYLSSDGDNFEIISRKTGVDAGDLMELNPFLDPDNVPSGVLVRLSADAPVFDDAAAGRDDAAANDEPARAVDAVTSSSEPESIFDFVAEDAAAGEPDPTEAELAAERNSILIILPFMSESDTQPKKAQLYADFYRGFLIAAHDNADSGHKDIDVIVADTNDDFNTSRQELSSLIAHDVAVVIAPEDHAQISMMADSAAARGVYVLNMFNFTDDTYLDNPWVIQGNINQALMYEKAIDAVMDEYPGFVPVILSADNSREEKAAFTDALAKKYRSNGLEVLEISFADGLEESDLAVLDSEKRYVFIPRSGSQMVFNRIAPAVLDLMEQEGGSERIRLFGYPDWTAYRGESLELLQRLNAKVYSRFACDEGDLDNQQMQESFISWYGEPMLEAVPSQAMLGYDVANYLIRALRNGSLGESLSDPMPYRGMQSTFKFKKNGVDGGYVNESLYLIEFLPGDRYSVKVL